MLYGDERQKEKKTLTHRLCWCDNIITLKAYTYIIFGSGLCEADTFQRTVSILNTGRVVVVSLTYFNILKLIIIFNWKLPNNFDDTMDMRSGASVHKLRIESASGSYTNLFMYACKDKGGKFIFICERNEWFWKFIWWLLVTCTPVHSNMKCELKFVVKSYWYVILFKLFFYFNFQGLMKIILNYIDCI